LMEKQMRLNEDLEAAAGIQRSLLPHGSLDMETMEVAWRFLPCDTIGGDIFNVVRLDETHWAIYMLDVSGHGVPSALVTVSASQMLHPQRGLLLKKAIQPPPYYEIRGPSEVLNLLDQEYPIERFNKYFTIAYLILDVKTSLVRYSNAAHPPPILVRRDGSLELLEEGGTIIGMGGVLPFEEGEKKLGPGDKLFVYTDGIPEYEDQGRRLYGQERFCEALLKLKDHPIAEIVDGVIEALMTYGERQPPRDDITLLGIEIKSGSR